MADQLREALEKIRALGTHDTYGRCSHCKVINGHWDHCPIEIADAALSAPPGQPEQGETGMMKETGTLNTTVHYEGTEQVFPCRCGEIHRGDYAAYDYAHCNCFHNTDLVWIDKPTDAMCPACGKTFTFDDKAESVTPPGVESGSGHTDDYVAWLRWVGDEEHRHLIVCDSDSPGAFKVYRRPND